MSNKSPIPQLKQRYGINTVLYDSCQVMIIARYTNYTSTLDIPPCGLACAITLLLSSVILSRERERVILRLHTLVIL